MYDPEWSTRDAALRTSSCMKTRDSGIFLIFLCRNRSQSQDLQMRSCREAVSFSYSDERSISAQKALHLSIVIQFPVRADSNAASTTRTAWNPAHPSTGRDPRFSIASMKAASSARRGSSRSEERRVGKEGCLRWGAEQSQVKKWS